MNINESTSIVYRLHVSISDCWFCCYCSIDLFSSLTMHPTHSWAQPKWWNKQPTTITTAAYRLTVECFVCFGFVCLAICGQTSNNNNKNKNAVEIPMLWKKPQQQQRLTMVHTPYVNRMKIAYGHNSTICVCAWNTPAIIWIYFISFVSHRRRCVLFISFYLFYLFAISLCPYFRRVSIVCAAFVSNMIIISHFCTSQQQQRASSSEKCPCLTYLFARHIYVQAQCEDN